MVSLAYHTGLGLGGADALNIFAALAGLRISITDILILIILPRVTAGILIVQSGEPRKMDKVVKIVTYGAAIVLVALALSSTALQIKFYYGGSFDDVVALNNLPIAFRSLVFVASVLVGARAVIVKYQTRSEKRVATVSLFFCSCLAIS